MHAQWSDCRDIAVARKRRLIKLILDSKALAIWNRKTLTPGKVCVGADDRTACAQHHVSLKTARARL